MMLTSDNESLAENKVLILYVLSNLTKAISNDSLFNIVNSVVELNYFYFQQFLLDLIEAKFISVKKTDTNDLYSITELGRETLSLTLDILPGIIKLKVDTNFKSTLDENEDSESVVSEYTPISETEYQVECKIVEEGNIVFGVKTYAYSRNQAQNIVENWKKNATIMYPKLLEILTANYENDLTTLAKEQENKLKTKNKNQ